MDSNRCTVADWHASLRASSPAKATIPPGNHRPGISAFDDTPPEVVQPALTDDILCLHRGGPKRVHRFRNGRRATFDVGQDTLTLLRRGQPARWITEGPIDYVHLTIGTNILTELGGGEDFLNRPDIHLADDVGFSDSLLANLVVEMLRVCGEGDESQLYYDALLTSLVLTLFRRSSGQRYNLAVGATASGVRGGLASWRLRAVIEYLHANRTRDISFDDLVRVSGLSRAHFYRAFVQSMGQTPGRYVERLRVDDARKAIEIGADLGETAESAGFSSKAAMTRAFRRALLMTPDAYRRYVR